MKFVLLIVISKSLISFTYFSLPAYLQSVEMWHSAPHWKHMATYFFLSTNWGFTFGAPLYWTFLFSCSNSLSHASASLIFRIKFGVIFSFSNMSSIILFRYLLRPLFHGLYSNFGGLSLPYSHDIHPPDEFVDGYFGALFLAEIFTQCYL